MPHPQLRRFFDEVRTKIFWLFVVALNVYLTEYIQSVKLEPGRAKGSDIFDAFVSTAAVVQICAEHLNSLQEISGTMKFRLFSQCALCRARVPVRFRVPRACCTVATWFVLFACLESIAVHAPSSCTLVSEQNSLRPQRAPGHSVAGLACCCRVRILAQLAPRFAAAPRCA